MRKAVLSVFAVLFLVAQAVTSSQSSVPPRSATDVTNADIRATIKMAPPDGIQDQQIRVVDMGKYNHARVTEVYHIIEGSGTFVTGGTISNARQVASDNVINTILVGPSTTGASIQGGQSRKVGPGDVIIIPPGVAHWFSSVEADMNYLVVRVDADHILPAGYVNPAVAAR